MDEFQNLSLELWVLRAVVIALKDATPNLQRYYETLSIQKEAILGNAEQTALSDADLDALRLKFQRYGLG